MRCSPSGSAAPAAPSGALGRSQKLWSGQLAGLGCAVGLPRSSTSAARSEHPGGSPDPRSGQLGQSTSRISEAQEQTARPSGCAAASRIFAADHVVRDTREPSDPHCRQLDQRAPGRSPEPGSRQLAGPGSAAGLPRSSPPGAQPATLGSTADLRIPGAGSSPALDALQLFPDL